MLGFTATTFGERFADTYDLGLEYLYTMATVGFLERMAGSGPALELAVGTGRIALPLTARGVQVDGIEVSPLMVARLRDKPGGDRVRVTLGDMADVDVPGRYPLIYLVYNTLFNLTTQVAQVRCFQNVAAHLTEDGVFVLEAFVPDLGRYRGGQSLETEAVGLDVVTIEACRHDPVAQRLDKVHVALSDAGARLYPVVLRYAWPTELDLMARLAGLRLRERWGGWNGEPFLATSGTHVSVYGR